LDPAAEQAQAFALTASSKPGWLVLAYRAAAVWVNTAAQAAGLLGLPPSAAGPRLRAALHALSRPSPPALIAAPY
jgi:hypothetical protein